MSQETVQDPASTDAAPTPEVPQESAAATEIDPTSTGTPA